MSGSRTAVRAGETWRVVVQTVPREVVGAVVCAAGLHGSEQEVKR